MLDDVNLCGKNVDISSAKFIGDVLFVSASLVLRGRKLFLPDHFEESSFADFPVYILTEKTSLGKSTIHRINGVRKTLEYGWLQKFIIVVSRDESNPDAVVEVFTWSFEYTGANLTASFHSSESAETMNIDFENTESTMKQVKVFFATLSVTLKEELTPLPAGCFPGLRLVYNGDKSAGYQAQGFKRSETLYTLQENCQFLYDRSLSARCHSLHFGIKSTLANKNLNKRRVSSSESIEEEVLEVARNDTFYIGEGIETADDSVFIREEQESAINESFLNSSCIATIDTSTISPRRRLTSLSTDCSFTTNRAKYDKPIAKRRRIATFE